MDVWGTHPLHTQTHTQETDPECSLTEVIQVTDGDPDQSGSKGGRRNGWIMDIIGSKSYGLFWQTGLWGEGMCYGVQDDDQVFSLGRWELELPFSELREPRVVPTCSSECRSWGVVVLET